MLDKEDKKKKTVREEWKDGVKYTWDAKGMCFASIHVGNAPSVAWEEWNGKCKEWFSGQRWQFIYSDYLKARAYETLVETLNKEDSTTEEPAREEKQKGNDLELLNG